MKENQNYIVRTVHAGVFFGQIESRNGDEIVMTNVRRIWYWAGAASLSQLAVDGPAKVSECKFTVTVPSMTILGVIEIIPCSDKADEKIKKVPEWKM